MSIISDGYIGNRYDIITTGILSLQNQSEYLFKYYIPTMIPGQVLAPGVNWVNRSGNAFLAMQQIDGNLVLYNAAGGVISNFNTPGLANRYLVINNNGSITVNNPDNSIFKTIYSGDGSPIVLAFLDFSPWLLALSADGKFTYKNSIT